LMLTIRQHIYNMCQ